MAEKYLSQIYYNPESPASFGGVDSIYRVVKDEGKHQISRNKIRLWLQKQDTYTLHKPVRYRFKRNRVIVGAIDEQWEADLVIMDSISKYNHGFKYILTVIDVLSKYAWAEPIKTKTGENLVKAFEKMLKKGRKSETFHTDKGTEFMNRKFQTFYRNITSGFSRRKTRPRHRLSKGLILRSRQKCGNILQRRTRSST
jgi:hypothetical protein